MDFKAYSSFFRLNDRSFDSRLALMNSSFWMMYVHLKNSVISKHRTVVGQTIQPLISIGHEHKKQRTQVVLDPRQVHLTLLHPASVDN